MSLYYDAEGYEVDYNANIYEFLTSEGMGDEDALAFATDYQDELDSFRDGDISVEQWHDFLDEFESVLEAEYDIDTDDYFDQ